MLRARVSASRNRKFALIANSAALVAPPDSAVRGGSLNGRLQPPIGGGSATARLTRREDDADLRRRRHRRRRAQHRADRRRDRPDPARPTVTIPGVRV